MTTFLQTIGALNDETRLTILRFIDINGAVCVCDIEASFGMIQSRISRHLKILKEVSSMKFFVSPIAIKVDSPNQSI